MSKEIVHLQYFWREQVNKVPQLRGMNPDKLTVTTLALTTHKRFYEGLYGEKTMQKYMSEGAELRRKDRAGYEEALKKLAPHLSDLRAMNMNTVRAVETLTSSDLVYAIGTARNIEYTNVRTPFQTDLFGLVKKRSVTDLAPLQAGGGVNLRDRFLRVRAENTTNSKNSWVGRGEFYSILNFEDGFELTWEAILSNQLDEWNDAMYELGQNAARTRAWLIIDAIRRHAPFIELPNGDRGPTIDNIEDAASYLGNQVIDGRTVSRTLTDIYVPGNWRGTASRAVAGSTLVFVGGANGDVQRYNPKNPAENITPHYEEVMAEIPIDDSNQSSLDWIAADPSRQPVEFAALAPFVGGPRILTKIPDIVELDNMGSYSEHVIETKVSDVCGAAVRDKSAVLLVSGRKPNAITPAP